MGADDAVRAPRLAALILVLFLGSGAAAEETAVTAGPVTEDTVWEGTLRVSGTVAVAADAVLTVKPGTVVLFAKGAELTVFGKIVALGTENAPIRFSSGEPSPAPADWAGIRFSGSRTGTVLARCSIAHADAVRIEGASPAIRDCEIVKGRVGVVIETRGAPEISGSRISGMTEGGIAVGTGSAPVVSRNTIGPCAQYGINSVQGAAPALRGNVVSDCGTGIGFVGAVPPIEGNVISRNKVGLGCRSTGRAQVIRGNFFRGNATGLHCLQFSGPLIERNEFTGNDNAILCSRSSSPLIRNNEVAGNGDGIACWNISRPLVVANNIHGNRRGIFLTMSSYAVIHENNIYENGVQVELGLMSSDWEERTEKKPERGREARLATRRGRGVAGPKEVAEARGDGVVIQGAVDAVGNWWGDRDTAEMEKKGPDANIGGLVDYHDRPSHPSEGYPGEYLEDRIDYGDWKKARIPEAGLN